MSQPHYLNIMNTDKIFNRQNSTLGIMDDLQFCIHSYDGCGRGCSGCLVDKDLKNRQRFTGLLSNDTLQIISSRTLEYYDWVQQNLNTKNTGYFAKDAYQVAHYSYTMRFGNHAELPEEELFRLAELLPSKFRIFSTGPTQQLEKFIKLNQNYSGRLFLEIIYDPFVDKANDIKQMMLSMRENDINGYPELVLTQKLLSAFSPQRFVDECIAPLSGINAQMQLGRYAPSKTRNFNQSQVVDIDDEVNWLAEVSKIVMQQNYKISIIPLGEYAITLLDEYGESKALQADGTINESLLPEPEPLDLKGIKDKTRDILLTSLYIDQNMDVYVWSESMGQHVLDINYGFGSLGNLKNTSIQEMVSGKHNKIEKMLVEIIRNLVSHPKCAPCRYKSFCASHAVPLFRKSHNDNGKHCYGYIPAIREFQKNLDVLDFMVDNFRSLEF